MKANIYKILILFCLIGLASSCYSIRVTNKNGMGQPFPNDRNDFYKDLNVIEIDTTLKLKMTSAEASMIEGCPTGGFHTFEYKVTFGSLLLNAITFGKVKKVKIKYVCLQPNGY